MKKQKIISVGDIMWVEFAGELIEVLQIDKEKAQIGYWSSAYPEDFNTNKCRMCDAFILFKSAIKLGTTK